MLDRLREAPVDVSLAPEPLAYRLADRRVDNVGGLPLTVVQERPLTGWSYIVKAIEDRTLALLILIMISPILLLIAILIFGPCEPLIPLMFLAYKQGMRAVWIIAAVFSAVTVAMIVGQSCLAYAGARLIQAHWMERYAHAMAGVVIALTALAVLWLGL